ncbi:MAG TPA: glycoside hydrolase family 20 zincin-like fold domain-containing protein, partial [Spirochaetia bacterium]|nr:glycoside hydrolase family 20 zincin-like fold domain-containing protein [Spirochaetia bacterium]
MFALRPGTTVILAGDPAALLAVGQRVQQSASDILHLAWSLHARGEKDGAVTLRVEPSSLPAQGYRISIRPSGVELIGADGPGLFYAAATFSQLLRQSPAGLPAGEIRDWPDFPV